MEDSFNEISDIKSNIQKYPPQNSVSDTSSLNATAIKADSNDSGDSALNSILSNTILFSEQIEASADDASYFSSKLSKNLNKVYKVNFGNAVTINGVSKSNR